MFLQLVTPPPGGPPITLSAAAQAAADSLFLYTPLQISAIEETVWRNRFNAASTPFVPWPLDSTNAVLGDATFIEGYDFTTSPPTPIPQGVNLMPAGETFVTPPNQPELALIGGSPQASNWDHLIYAYIVENTRIFDVFSKVLETYFFSERLEVPSPASQQFWRSTEYLLFGETIPSMLWTASSRLRRDEIASRATLYYWMFGTDLSHARELAVNHPYEKPTSANRDFIPTFEAFGREVWRGIVNAKNTSGENTTDDEAIATGARRIFDMMATRRLNGNLSREEFRAVAVMSWLHLAVMYDSSPVQDLKATASSPEQRLAKIGERVGITVHTKSKALFDLSEPLSFLMQSIETGIYNTAANAKLLYQPGTITAANAEVVIDQYCLATGRDLKTSSVTLAQRGTTARPIPAATATPPPRQVAKARANGHTMLVAPK